MSGSDHHVRSSDVYGRYNGIGRDRPKPEQNRLNKSIDQFVSEQGDLLKRYIRTPMGSEEALKLSAEMLRRHREVQASKESSS